MKIISEISLLWFIPLLLLAALLTFWFYRNESWLKDLPRSLILSLKVLRFVGLSLVFLLVFGILFKVSEYKDEKPIFINLIDASKSMLNFKDSSTVSKQINDYRAALKQKYGDRFEIQEFVIGDDFSVLKQVRFNYTKSNLALGFEEIYQKYYNRNIGGICFISDGNYNEGNYPFYAAEKIPFTPIFTLGVGDTISKRDQLIRNVAANELAFLKNKFPVEVDVEAIKMGKVDTEVSIFHKGKKLASKTVRYQNGMFDYEHVSFEVEANELGFQQYTVEVKALQNEYTLKNNRTSFYVEVLDARNKVLMLASAPHPDVAALKYVLEKDENVEVESKWLGDWDKNLNKVDWIVFHEPGISSINSEILDVVVKSGKPVLYIVGPNSNNAQIQKLNIGMNIPSSSQMDEVQVYYNTGFEGFEISSYLKTEINYFPPLKVRFGQVKLSPQNKVMFSQRIGTLNKQEPLLFFGEKNATKYAVIYGEGLWRWKMNDFSKNKNTQAFEELFQKISQYLVVKQNASSLRVKLPKRFSSSEEIRVNAEFYNDALELITSPKISFSLNDGKNKNNYEFASTGNFYSLSLGKLKKGTYTWSATATHNGKKHEKKGTFVVEELEIESLDTKANHTVLQQISSNSNASFHNLKDFSKLLASLEKRNDIATLSHEESSFRDLLDYFWILVITLLVFSLEWFLRRRNGAY
jgi:hypothetical protein